MRHNSPLAAQVVTPVKEAASGLAHVSVINRRKCCQSAMQGHYGGEVVVRKHTSPSVIAPMDAFHHLCEDGIMTGRAGPRVRSRTSIENRPFLCQPPMSQSSFYGRFGGGGGHQRVLQLLAVTPQRLAGPLTQGEWKLSCVLTEWMARTLKLGYSLQFCSVPPPFRGIREANLSP